MRDVKTLLDRMPGAEAHPGPNPNVVLYKVRGKLFAILESRKVESVIVKTDPEMVQPLREKYEGISHHSHLDPRYWICMTLGSDVPPGEVKRLIRRSHSLVSAALPKQSRAASPRRRSGSRLTRRR